MSKMSVSSSVSSRFSALYCLRRSLNDCEQKYMACFSNSLRSLSLMYRLEDRKKGFQFIQLILKNSFDDYLSISGMRCRCNTNSNSSLWSTLMRRICIKMCTHFDRCDEKLPGRSISDDGLRQIPCEIKGKRGDSVSKNQFTLHSMMVSLH